MGGAVTASGYRLFRRHPELSSKYRPHVTLHFNAVEVPGNAERDVSDCPGGLLHFAGGQHFLYQAFKSAVEHLPHREPGVGRAGELDLCPDERRGLARCRQPVVGLQRRHDLAVLFDPQAAPQSVERI